MKAKLNKGTLFILEISCGYLKLLKCRAGGNQPVQFISAEALELKTGDDKSNFAPGARKLFKGMDYDGGPVIVSLPRSEATLRFLKIPAHSPEEMRRIFALQASRYLPYPESELITGYQLLSTDNEGYSQVNLVILLKDVLNAPLEACAAVKSAYPKIILSSYGIASLYARIRPGDQGVVMAVDVDACHAEIVIIAGGKFIFSRAVKISSEYSDPAKALIIEEINKTRAAYLRDFPDKDIEKAVFLGDAAALKDLVADFDRQSNLKAEIADYSAQLQFGPELRDKVFNLGLSFAGLAGLPLSDTDESLILSPVEEKHRRERAMLFKRHIKSAALFAVLLACLWAAVLKDMDNKRNYLKKINSEIGKIEDKARQLEDLETRLEIMRNPSRSADPILDMIRGIYEVIPQGVSLAAFDYNDNGQVELRGMASELKLVSGFVGRLEGLKAFKGYKVKINYINARQSQAVQSEEFEIICSK